MLPDDCRTPTGSTRGCLQPDLLVGPCLLGCVVLVVRLTDGGFPADWTAVGLVGRRLFWLDGRRTLLLRPLCLHWHSTPTLAAFLLCRQLAVRDCLSSWWLL